MTIEVDFSEEEPDSGKTQETFEASCLLCHQPLKGNWWLIMGVRMRATVHDRCLRAYDSKAGKKIESHQIPERFAHWDGKLFAHQDVLSTATAFAPDSKLRVMALIGPPGTGKSRLMWQVVQSFFDEWGRYNHQERWCEYMLFSDLASGEYDQSRLAKVKSTQFLFLDDIRDMPSGRMKSQIQEIIRYRVQSQKWTFLTIDDPGFDFDLINHVFRERAVVAVID